MVKLIKQYWKYGKEHSLKKNYSVKEMEKIIEYEKEKTQFWVFMFTFWAMLILMLIVFYFSMSYKFGFICTCEGVELFNMTANEVLHTKI